MMIRNFRPGDEAAQVEIYNTAAAALPRFKPATVQEIQRRTRARDFDPGLRFFAEEGGKVVGYCSFNPNGRMSAPWCLPGKDACTEPLFIAALTEMKRRGIAKAFAAYRADWPIVQEYFLLRGFVKARDMVNFVIDLVEMPTPAARGVTGVSHVSPQDAPAILALMPKLIQLPDPKALEKHLFFNPYFQPEALFAIRSRQGGELVAVGILVYEPTYADPHAVDPNMPCYRLGAFGAENQSTKRIKGLFSFVAKQDVKLPLLGMELLGHAAFRMRDSDDVSALAAQAPSDAPELLTFYQRNFRRQGSFPVYEKAIG